MNTKEVRTGIITYRPSKNIQQNKINNNEVIALNHRIDELVKIIAGMASKRDLQIMEDKVICLTETKLGMWKNMMLKENFNNKEDRSGSIMNKAINDNLKNPQSKPSSIQNIDIKIVKNLIKEELKVYENCKVNKTFEESTIEHITNTEKTLIELNKKLNNILNVQHDYYNENIIKYASIETMLKDSTKVFWKQLEEIHDKLNNIKTFFKEKIAQLSTQFEINKKVICTKISALPFPKINRPNELKTDSVSLKKNLKPLLINDNIMNMSNEELFMYKPFSSKRSSVRNLSVSAISEEDRELMHFIKDNIVEINENKDPLGASGTEESFHSARDYSYIGHSDQKAIDI